MSEHSEVICETYSVVETAKILGTGRNQTYAAVKAGEIPSIKVGKRLLVPKQALYRMLAGGKAV